MEVSQCMISHFERTKCQSIARYLVWNLQKARAGLAEIFVSKEKKTRYA